MDNEPRVQARQQVKDQQSCISVFVAYLGIPRSKTRSTSSDMSTVFHAWSYGRFAEIQGSLWRKKLHRTNQGFNFLGSSFTNRDNVRAPIQFRREIRLHFSSRWFSLDISSAAARVAPYMLKTLAILSDTTVRRYEVDR